MSNKHPRDDREQIDIVYELPPSAQGTYRYERQDGTWTLDENGDLEDSLLRVSALDELRAEGLVAVHPPPRDAIGHWGRLPDEEALVPP